METPNTDRPPDQEIAVLLRDLLRTIKAVCMYPETNSLPQSLRQSFASRLLDLLEEQGEIRLGVDNGVILRNGEIVHRDKSREDNLAAIFFSAGITELSFKRGLTAASIDRLLGAIRTYLTAPAGHGDLPSLLWEAAPEGFSFQSAEDVALAEYDAGFRVQEYFHREDERRRAGGDTFDGYEAIFLSEDALEGRAASETVDGHLTPGGVFEVEPEEAARLRAQAAAEAMGLSNLPPVPVPSVRDILSRENSLSADEQARMEQLLAQDAAFNLYESTSHLLIELLMQETTLKGFDETAIICEKMLNEFVAQGQVAHAAFLLRSLRNLGERIRGAKPRWADRLEGIYMTAGSRERLRLLAKALNEHTEITESDLRRYLDLFDWQALSALTDLLGELEHRPHRETLCRYLVDHGRGKEEILAKGVYDKRWYVVRNSVMILGHIGDDRALQHLKQAVAHEDRRVRIELVEAVRGKEHAGALEILGRLVFDPDEEVHREAMAALMGSSGAGAFEALAGAVTAESFGQLDPQDQIALLVAYSRRGKERAVPHLARLIARFNPTRNPIRTFFRAAAFDALEQNPSEKAGALLQRLTGSWRPDIRRRATRCLSRRKAPTGGEA
ncbi:MAG TPA: HEAT repeat domain-containing protein [candidate division Zixibacteria bacterium]|nr:HEAT repeat domain-containing protein [candidate division Zixibacteria bacterium]